MSFHLSTPLTPLARGLLPLGNRIGYLALKLGNLSLQSWHLQEFKTFDALTASLIFDALTASLILMLLQRQCSCPSRNIQTRPGFATLHCQLATGLPANCLKIAQCHWVNFFNPLHRLIDRTLYTQRPNH